MKLGASAAALATLLGGGLLAEPLVDRDSPETTGTSHDAGVGAAHSPSAELASARSTDSAGSHDRGHKSEPAVPVRGLAVAEHGLRIVVEDPELRRSRTETLRYRVVDERGDTIPDFSVEHEKRMHLIVVRRDLTGFQHLHPQQDRDGSWATRLRLDEAGTYRVFADFTRDDEAYTLASDLRVDGGADFKALPAPTNVATVGPYEVRVEASSARRGAQAGLRYTVVKDGQPVETERYLGAGGHLVALREGDLAFLHVHPAERGHGGEAGGDHGNSVGFAATFPTQGRYRLFLQFKHQRRVRTVAFTQEVK